MEWPAPLTVQEVAGELCCSEDEVRALIRAGELPTVACGIRPGLVPRHRLDDYRRRALADRVRVDGVAQMRDTDAGDDSRTPEDDRRVRNAVEEPHSSA